MTARESAFLVIRDVFGEPPRGAQAAFEFRLRKANLDARDRAFAAELAYGTIKFRRLLDWMLAPYLGEKAAKLPFSIAEILRLGLYQLHMMHGVEARAAVHETVSLALAFGHKGTAGLVNAVLRRIDREGGAVPQPSDFPDRTEYLATAKSFPTWIVRRLQERFGDDKIEAILDGLNRKPAPAIGVDGSRLDAEGVGALFASMRAQAQPSAFASDSYVLDGSIAELQQRDDAPYVVQSESAAMPVDLLAPKPGERVVECCAGRGNKTLKIAYRLGGTAFDAIELDERKAEKLRERLVAAGHGEVNVVVADARESGHDGSADAVLVDAPCSGLGVIGRHPEARWRKDARDAERLAPLQRELLAAGLRRLAPGGRLVYAVCSPDPAEGERVVAAVVAEFADVVPLAVPERYAPVAIAADRPGEVLVPPGIDGRDGFYIASFSRRA